MTKGKTIQGRSCVAPIYKLNRPDLSIMLIQLEHRRGSPYGFEEVRDRKAFDIVSRIIASILERIQVSNKTS